MRVLKSYRGLRKLGVNYGLPVFYLEVGYGVNKEVERVVERLLDEGLQIRKWIVIKGGLLGERDAHLLISGLKACKCYIEVEEDGTYKDPSWFPEVDRWIVDYISGNLFNYGALRSNRDMVLYRGNNLEKFAEETVDLQALRGALVDNLNGSWEAIKNFDIRVYEKEEEQE